MRVILSDSRFNANGYTWDYILVGNNFDSGGYIENEIKSSENLGEEGLVQKINNQKIYVKKWSDVILQCENRHDFLNQKLEIKKEKLIQQVPTVEEAVKIAKEK